jgi:imidazolonepropionase-like amidohydrolase
MPQRRPGAYADFIALDSDPWRSVKALENVQLVMKDGKKMEKYSRAGAGNSGIGPWA